MSEKRLFLLDAYALIYRAYYALIRSPRVTSKGLNTSAIFGFVNTLDDILRRENPTHIAVCFDPRGGHTFRHEVYPDYKAQRDKQPEDITNAIPYIKELLEAYRIPAIEVEGYEADDVIGTLAHQAQAEGFTTYMMTLDKDYGQLVTDHVLMYRPATRGEGFEVRGPQQVCERYGIRQPVQVIDLLALEGDVSDNIPGCPGVGEKTAAKLISEWGSVENLLDNTASLKGALKTKIETNAEQIRFSKMLVTIKTDVPLDGITVDGFERRPVDEARLIDLYRRLEFNMFLRRMTAANPQVIVPEAPPAPKAESSMGSLFDMPVKDEPMVAPVAEDTAPRNYRMEGSEAGVAQFVEQAVRGAVGVNIYAMGPDAMTATIKGVALAREDGEAIYVCLQGDDTKQMLSMLEPLFTSPEATLVSHDIKRQWLLLRRLGIELTARYFDTSVAHYLLEPEMKHGLDMVAGKYLPGVRVIPAPDKKTAESPEALAERVCSYAHVALRLMPVLLENIEKEGLTPLLNDIELPLITVLASMEWVGVRIDPGELAALSRQYTERLTAMEEQVYELAGVRFNIGSPMQVGEVLFERLKIAPKAKRTRTGAFSTTEEILEKFRHEHPIVDLILKIRALRKLLSTYINALPSLVDPRDGKIHTSFNQTVTATGRISSTNPNLQNIPVRSDDGREIRRTFIPDDGCLLLSADYSQIELRLMAELSGDPSMVEAFLSGADIHRATAAKIYHHALDEVTDTERRNAKTANFGIIYGISAFGLSERLGIPRGEAKDLITGYFRTYPGVKDYMDQSIERAREQGYVTTVMGRKRMLPDINSRNAVVRGYAERNAINAPLQGSAADIIKRAMVDVDRRMRQANMQSRMILQVHDELIFNVVPSELDEMKRLVVECMEGAYRGRIPLEVSMGVGYNWLEAH